MIYSRSYFLLSVTILSAEPRHIRISTTIRARALVFIKRFAFKNEGFQLYLIPGQLPIKARSKPGLWYPPRVAKKTKNKKNTAKRAV